MSDGPIVPIGTVQTTQESKMDAVYRMYLEEKDKHEATKQVLGKAIDLASQLLSEI